METGLVLVVPEAAALVDRWRVRTVPMARIGVPAHVTVLYPWVPAPVPDDALLQTREALRDCGPVTLTFRRVATFPEVVYLVPEPKDHVRRLTHAMCRVFPECPPYGGQYSGNMPHLTVAITAPEDLEDLRREIEQVLAPALPFTATVENLTVMEQQPDGGWRQGHHLALGG